jgi:hypothetical protein
MAIVSGDLKGSFNSSTEIKLWPLKEDRAAAFKLRLGPT